MIRVNLLEKRQEAPAAAPKPQVTTGGASGILAFIVVLLGIAAAGVHWYQLDHRINGMRDEIRQADDRIAQLKKALQTMDEYKAKKAALEHRVEIISDLKRRQNVPVVLLDMVSRQLPDFLWLEALEEKGGQISMRGKATTYNAVSNFYNNLKDSPFFGDVTLGVTQKAPEGVSFVLTCRFKPPQAPAEAAPQPAAPQPAAPAAPRKG